MQHTTRVVCVDHVQIGGGAPVVIQSMTDTDTAGIPETVQQIYELWRAGSELVRITVNTAEAARAVPEIRRELDAMGCNVPLIGDFHYNGHRLLTQYPECASALSKYRINPGNVGKGSNRDPQLLTMIETAIRYDKPVRIGANWGSLDQVKLAAMMDQNAQRDEPLPLEQLTRLALLESALESAEQAIAWGLPENRIIISCKVSKVQDLILIYRELAQRCHYPLHLGLTEAGTGSKGIVASTAALAILLQEGIGDTIRISLTPDASAPSRVQEVIVAQELLQTMGIRAFTPLVTACPGCGRTSSSFFRELAQKTQHYLRDNMPHWKQRYPGVENMSVAVMGCVVNGPGESKLANIGISLPGNGEAPVAPVYIDGQKTVTLKGTQIAEEFQHIIARYVESRYASRSSE